MTISTDTRADLHLDLAATAARRDALRRYMASEVLSPTGFCCSSYEACLASKRPTDRFFEGQLSHVGRRYDLTRGGRPLRIVVVGQEYGFHHQRSPDEQRGIDLDERYRMVHDGSGLDRRYYADGNHRGRNPHMRGTTSALRILLGQGLGADHASEFLEVDGERFHLFDAFGLVNALLCSAGPPGNSNGNSTRTMRRNCLRHFAATLRILEPTVVVLQGLGVRRWVDSAFSSARPLGPHLEEAFMEERRMLVCTLSHPAARGDLRWGDRLDRPYLVDVVEPTLRLALARL
jgi:hypothetical protein